MARGASGNAGGFLARNWSNAQPTAQLAQVCCFRLLFVYMETCCFCFAGSELNPDQNRNRSICFVSLLRHTRKRSTIGLWTPCRSTCRRAKCDKPSRLRIASLIQLRSAIRASCVRCLLPWQPTPVRRLCSALRCRV